MGISELKSALKRNRLLYGVNAAVKGRHVRKNYDRIVRSYADKPVLGSPESLMIQRSGERLRRFQSLQRPLRIFYVGTDELQDSSGILQALGRLGETTWFEQAPGKYGQYLHGTRPERQDFNSRRLLQTFEELARVGRTPDIILGQMQGRYLHGTALDEIRTRYGTLIANVNMDDRHQYFGTRRKGAWGGTYALIPHSDLALTAAPECVDWYLKEGCPALFFPEASDENIFRPVPELAKIHDVSFVGARYGIREQVVTALRKAGISVSAYGTGWESGRLPNDAVPRLFAQSRIILGVGTIGHSPDFYTLKIRDFDATMSGSCYLTHPNPDLDLLFEAGKEMLTYASLEECVHKARYYLQSENEREAIAAAGRRRSERDHTWALRFSQVIDWLRSL